MKALVGFETSPGLKGMAVLTCFETEQLQSTTMPTMTVSNTTQETAQQHYLATGEHDSLFRGWPGDNMLDAARKGDAILRTALIAEVRSRSAHATLTPALQAIDVVALTRSKVTPMVAGLFPRHEQAAVAVDARTLGGFPWCRTTSTRCCGPCPGCIPLGRLRTYTWPALAPNCSRRRLRQSSASATRPRATSASTTSATTIRLPTTWFTVHEAAHIFHNCKRATIGLPETQRREFLLDIDFGMRETFAYACEAYSRLLALGHTRAERQEAAHTDGSLPGHDTVNTDEYLDILREAIEARNGWKRILQRCASRKSPRPTADTGPSVGNVVPTPVR